MLDALTNADRPRPQPRQGVAQLVARAAWAREVVGSSPTALTITTLPCKQSVGGSIPPRRLQFRQQR